MWIEATAEMESKHTVKKKMVFFTLYYNFQLVVDCQHCASC